MTKYRIIDLQGIGIHADEVYESKEDIREHLLSYHSIDWSGEFPITRMSLEDLLDYGDWEIEEVNA